LKYHITAHIIDASIIEFREGGKMMNYRVHQFSIKMTKDAGKLEQFLNELKGEVVAIVPNVTPFPITMHAHVDFLLIIEKVG
jgi:hypothetical protein